MPGRKKTNLRPASAAERIPPRAVRLAAARGLAWRAEYGRGGTAVGVARARDLSNGRTVSWETVERMFRYFRRREPIPERGVSPLRAGLRGSCGGGMRGGSGSYACGDFARRVSSRFVAVCSFWSSRIPARSKSSSVVSPERSRSRSISIRIDTRTEGREASRVKSLSTVTPHNLLHKPNVFKQPIHNRPPLIRPRF